MYWRHTRIYYNNFLSCHWMGRSRRGKLHDITFSQGRLPEVLTEFHFTAVSYILPNGYRQSHRSETGAMAETKEDTIRRREKKKWQSKSSPVSKLKAAGASPLEKAVLRKGATSRAGKLDAQAAPTSQLMTKLFPSLKLKALSARTNWVPGMDYVATYTAGLH